jgi:hypothetical protein
VIRFFKIDASSCVHSIVLIVKMTFVIITLPCYYSWEEFRTMIFCLEYPDGNKELMKTFFNSYRFVGKINMDRLALERNAQQGPIEVRKRVEKLDEDKHLNISHSFEPMNGQSSLDKKRSTTGSIILTMGATTPIESFVNVPLEVRNAKDYNKYQ